MAWYHHKAQHTKRFTGDKDIILSFLAKASSKMFSYIVHRPLTNSWSYGVQARTIQQAIQNEHTDIEVWLMANPSQRRFDHKTKEYRLISVSNSNIVIDIDKFKYIKGDTPEIRKNAMILYLRNNNIPIPTILIETSPYSYHLWYNNDPKNSVQWNQDRVISMLAAIAQVPSNATDNFYECLKDAGVDPSYISQSLSAPKYRVPGTVNWAASNLSGKPVIVSGWILSDIKMPDEYMPYSDVLKLRNPTQQPQEVNANPRKKPVQLKKYRPFFCKYTNKVISDPKLSQKVAFFLSNNYWLLQRGIFRIHQSVIGEMLGISQVQMSRILSSLVKNGCLSNCAPYLIGYRAKAYGIGSSLKDDLRAEYVDNSYDFWLPYESGNSWLHFLEDVRQAVYKNVTLSDITRIITEKQGCRPLEKHRSPKEIARAYDRCLDYQNKQNNKVG